MKERWIEAGPGVDEKQEEWLNAWCEGGRIEFESAEAKQKYRETTQMVKDAIQLKQTPRRVPIAPSTGYFPLEYAGVTPYEAMYDREKSIQAAQKFFEDFDQDLFIGPTALSGRVLDILDLKMYQWPGHGVSRAVSYTHLRAHET